MNKLDNLATLDEYVTSVSVFLQQPPISISPGVADFRDQLFGLTKSQDITLTNNLLVTTSIQFPGQTGVTAEGAGGYARELTPDEKAKQQEVLDGRIAAADCVITTAGVPGRPAPRIIGRAAVERMKPEIGRAHV